MDTYHKYLKYKKKYLKLKNELFGGMETAEPIQQQPKGKFRIHFFTKEEKKKYFTKEKIEEYKDLKKKTKCSNNSAHKCMLAFMYPIIGNISENRVENFSKLIDAQNIEDRSLAERNVRLEAFVRKEQFDERDIVIYRCATCNKTCKESDSSQLMDSDDLSTKRRSDNVPESQSSSKKLKLTASLLQESDASLSQESAAASSSQELYDSSSLRRVSFVNLTEDDDEYDGLTESAASQKVCSAIDLTTYPDSMGLQKVCSAIDLTQPELKTVRDIDWAVLISECRDMEARRDARNALRNIDPFNVSGKPQWLEKKTLKEITAKCFYTWMLISEEDLCIINRYKEEHGEELLKLIIQCSKGRICHKQLYFRHARTFTTYSEADVCAINIACKEGHYGVLKYFCRFHQS
jgi:hypothetical protein